MSILINRDTKVIVQGITGAEGSFHSEQCLNYGTKIVAGVTPGKKGHEILGVPIFNFVKEAKKATDANVSIIFVPAKNAVDAIIEAVDAELELVVCITEGIPILDMIKVKEYMKGKKTRLIGPNSPGVITPEQCKLGIMPNYIHLAGHIGIVSRSGTLTYEAVYRLTKLGLGQSTVVGIGGDMIIGTDFIDIMEMFNDDPNTNVVVMIGEIGGSAEEEVAEWIKENMTKPVVAYICGQSAPFGTRMGHAGAIIYKGKDTAFNKIKELDKAGVTIVMSINDIGLTLLDLLKKHDLLYKCLVKNNQNL